MPVTSPVSDPLGVRATNRLDEICAIDADAVVYSPMLADEGEILALLGSGKNVVTPIGYTLPPRECTHGGGRGRVRRGRRHVARHRRTSRRHHRALPTHVQRVLPEQSGTLRMEEFSDIRNYAGHEHGARRDAVRAGARSRGEKPMLKVMASGFLQSIDMVAHELGWTLDEKKRTKHEMSVATRPIDSPVGVIEPGTVAAQRFTWQGIVNDEPVITVRTNWMMDDGHLSDGWKLGEQRFEMRDRGRLARAAPRHVPRLATRRCSARIRGSACSHRRCTA